MRKGKPVSLSKKSISCTAALGYLGFEKIPEDVYTYLSCEGEKYKASPSLVKNFIDQLEIVPPPKPYLTFKRWDQLEAPDEPELVIFFAQPDILSALFYLIQFDEHDLKSVKAPMQTGCTSIITSPLAETRKENPQSISY